VSLLPDYLRPGLDLVFVGINPGLRSEAAGHHYAGPGNHFWPLLFEAGFVSEPLTHADDARVLEWNIGLTNMVPRASRSITDLTLQELRAGAAVLRQKLLAVRPKLVAFNGKRIYEVFAGHPAQFGVQDETLDGIRLFVMPSTSARTASYQRADKLKFFRSLYDVLQASQGAEAAAS
jgi:TDG/mug DNA glycosylase family protein